MTLRELREIIDNNEEYLDTELRWKSWHFRDEMPPLKLTFHEDIHGLPDSWELEEINDKLRDLLEMKQRYEKAKKRLKGLVKLCY